MEKKERLMSLDALRGADMFCIMGGSSLVVALCALFGAKDGWLATQMTHVAWHGFRHHDTIFPLFLFLAGVSWPYSLAGQRARGKSTAAIVRKIAVRMLLLVFFGFATERFFAFDFAGTRYASVLGHIGVGWAVAAGAHPDIFAAQDHMCAPYAATYQPDPGKAAVLDALYRKYQKLATFAEERS